MGSYMSDVNKGVVFHVNTKRQATNEARRRQRDEGGSGQNHGGGGWGITWSFRGAGLMILPC